MEKVVLGIFAHPDDAEIVAAGTLSLLKKAGWFVHIATMTPGDKGSAELSREEISAVRTAEAAASARLLDGKYHCLGFDDAYILYDRVSINKVVTLIREVKPDVVITASPNDYMVDHEMTSRIVQTACFCAGIRNMDAVGEPFGSVPHLYYADPLESKDIFGNFVEVPILVDITDEMDKKAEMLASHKSQRDWLLAHHKIDEYILSMKRHGENRGKEINVKYAEGFRQHLGHAFPQNNLLKEQLFNNVLINKSINQQINK
jgi:LmbE family N-acetylglucosaminyl deacetylase